MNRIDIMTDIETLGKGDNSTIIQLSAYAFDIRTGELLSEFNQYVDITEEILDVDGDTLKWWLNTDKELFTDIINRGDTLGDNVMQFFSDWIKGLESTYRLSDSKSVYLWGNGILFDNRIIKSHMEENCIDYPIFYRNDRDLRTLLDLAATKLNTTEQEVKDKFKDNNLVLHNALDDVKQQIKLATGCYNILIK